MRLLILLVIILVLCMLVGVMVVCDCDCMTCEFFFFKQKTAYEMRISDWSSDVCSSDLSARARSRLRLCRPLPRSTRPKQPDFITNSLMIASGEPRFSAVHH